MVFTYPVVPWAISTVFLALVFGALGGFLAASAVHWVLFHRMRGIDGLLRANYAIAKRAETRAERQAQPLPTPAASPSLFLDPEQIMELARRNGLTADAARR